MATKNGSEPSELSYGYFYQLCFLDPPYVSNLTDQWVVSDFQNEHCAYAEVSEHSHRDRHDCPIDPTHVSCRVYIPTLVDLFGWPPIAPFISNQDDALVNSELAEQLKSSGLNGVEVHLVDVIEDQRCPKPTIFTLLYNGPEIRRSGWRGPESKNKCPFCEYGPLWCQVCQDRKYFCPRCGKDCRPKMNELDEAYADRTRRVLGAVIEPCFWDGSDLPRRSVGRHHSPRLGLAPERACRPLLRSTLEDRR